jgi:hypothetical protein
VEGELGVRVVLVEKEEENDFKREEEGNSLRIVRALICETKRMMMMIRNKKSAS